MPGNKIEAAFQILRRKPLDHRAAYIRNPQQANSFHV
jgi:hypothetical protein